MDVLNSKKSNPNKGYLKQPTTYSQPQTHITIQANLFPNSTIAISYECWHVMVAIQLSQMLLAKSTTRFTLQAYLGHDIIISITWIKRSRFCNRSMIKKNRLAYITSVPCARSHLHSVGPHPCHSSFTAQSYCPHLRGNSSSLGTNVTIPGQNYKFSN
jgi:hypothetical protein